MSLENPSLYRGRFENQAAPAWMDILASAIIGNWPQWEAEADQTAQREQDSRAGDMFLWDAVRNKIGHIYANHSK